MQEQNFKKRRHSALKTAVQPSRQDLGPAQLSQSVIGQLSDSHLEALTRSSVTSEANKPLLADIAQTQTTREAGVAAHSDAGFAVPDSLSRFETAGPDTSTMESVSEGLLGQFSFGTETAQSGAGPVMRSARSADPLSFEGLGPVGSNTQVSKSKQKSQPTPESVARAGMQGSSTNLPYRGELEVAFGQDLSHIPVYQDSRASQASDALNAHAYAHNGAIALGSGRDLRTVAEEVTHVLQSEGGGGGAGLTDPAGAVETEAGQIADSVCSGESFNQPVGGGIGAQTVARKPKSENTEHPQQTDDGESDEEESTSEAAADTELDKALESEPEPEPEPAPPQKEEKQADSPQKDEAPKLPKEVAPRSGKRGSEESKGAKKPPKKTSKKPRVAKKIAPAQKISKRAVATRSRKSSTSKYGGKSKYSKSTHGTGKKLGGKPGKVPDKGPSPNQKKLDGLISDAEALLKVRTHAGLAEKISAFLGKTAPTSSVDRNSVSKLKTLQKACRGRKTKAEEAKGALSTAKAVIDRAAGTTEAQLPAFSKSADGALKLVTASLGTFTADKELKDAKTKLTDLKTAATQGSTVAAAFKTAYQASDLAGAKAQVTKVAGAIKKGTKLSLLPGLGFDTKKATLDADLETVKTADDKCKELTKAVTSARTATKVSQFDGSGLNTAITAADTAANGVSGFDQAGTTYKQQVEDGKTDAANACSNQASSLTTQAGGASTLDGVVAIVGDCGTLSSQLSALAGTLSIAGAVSEVSDLKAKAETVQQGMAAHKSFYEAGSPGRFAAQIGIAESAVTAAKESFINTGMDKKVSSMTADSSAYDSAKSALDTIQALTTSSDPEAIRAVMEMVSYIDTFKGISRFTCTPHPGQTLADSFKSAEASLAQKMNESLQADYDPMAGPDPTAINAAGLLMCRGWLPKVQVLGAPPIVSEQQLASAEQMMGTTTEAIKTATEMKPPVMGSSKENCIEMNNVKSHGELIGLYQQKIQTLQSLAGRFTEPWTMVPTEITQKLALIQSEMSIANALDGQLSPEEFQEAGGRTPGQKVLDTAGELTEVAKYAALGSGGSKVAGDVVDAAFGPDSEDAAPASGAARGTTKMVGGGLKVAASNVAGIPVISQAAAPITAGVAAVGEGLATGATEIRKGNYVKGTVKTIAKMGATFLGSLGDSAISNPAAPIQGTVEGAQDIAEGAAMAGRGKKKEENKK